MFVTQDFGCRPLAMFIRSPCTNMTRPPHCPVGPWATWTEGSFYLPGRGCAVNLLMPNPTAPRSSLHHWCCPQTHPSLKQRSGKIITVSLLRAIGASPFKTCLSQHCVSGVTDTCASMNVHIRDVTPVICRFYTRLEKARENNFFLC